MIKGMPRGITGWLCEYHDELQRDVIWNKQGHEVKVNKAEISDRSHNLFTDGGELIELYKLDEEIKDYFAVEMTKLVSYMKDNKKYYRAVGEDHYRNAMNYFLLAVDRIPVIERKAQPSTQNTLHQNSSSSYGYVG
jgi:hypothetical protein